MKMRFQIRLVRFGSETHGQDLESLRVSGLPLPYPYVERIDPRRNAHWVRVLDHHQAIVSGFAIHTTMSRALPGTVTGRVDRLGRRLHEPLIPSIGDLLVQAAHAIPRLQRLDVRLFDEDPTRRRAIADAIIGAGGRPSDHRVLYGRTIVMDLRRAEDGTWPSIGRAARYRLRKFSRIGRAAVRPITDARYALRMQNLFRETFSRTGATAPMVDMRQVIECASTHTASRLVGVFLDERRPPHDLVAFMRAEFHGDHASYEEGASDRSADVRNLPLGYPLMFDLLEWTSSRGGTWFDFGGVPLEGSPTSVSLAGISEFKRQFSRKEVEIAEEFSIAPRPVLITIANATRRLARLVGR